MFYFGIKYTARVQGSTAVAVRCEKCFEKYYYQLVCTAVGRDSAPYGIGIETAKKRARQNAKRKLRRMLETAIASVPCPHCSYYQETMIPRLRAPRLRWLRKFGVYSAVVGGILAAVAAIVTMMHIDKPEKMDIVMVQVFWAFPVIPLLCAAAALLVRRHKNSHYNPNDPEAEQERLTLAQRFTITKEQAEALMEQQDV